MSDTFTRDQFEWLAQVQRDPAVSSSGFELAFVISQHINRQSREAWPTQETLARTLRMSDRGVRKLVEQLASAGHLRVSVQRGRHNPNRYRLILKNRNESSTYADGKPEPEFHLKREKTGTFAAENRNSCSKKPEPQFLQNHLREPSEEPSEDISPPTPKSVRGRAGKDSPTGAEIDGFQEWYRNYPLHKEPRAAEAAYRRVLKKRLATPAQLLAGAIRYGTEQRRPDGSLDPFTKHPATWLNKGCWADEPSPTPTPQARMNGSRFDHIAAAARGYVGMDDTHDTDEDDDRYEDRATAAWR